MKGQADFYAKVCIPIEQLKVCIPVEQLSLVSPDRALPLSVFITAPPPPPRFVFGGLDFSPDEVKMPAGVD